MPSIVLPFFLPIQSNHQSDKIPRLTNSSQNFSTILYLIHSIQSSSRSQFVLRPLSIHPSQFSQSAPSIHPIQFPASTIHSFFIQFPQFCCYMLSGVEPIHPFPSSIPTSRCLLFSFASVAPPPIPSISILYYFSSHPSPRLVAATFWGGWQQTTSPSELFGGSGDEITTAIKNWAMRRLGLVRRGWGNEYARLAHTNTDELTAWTK